MFPYEARLFFFSFFLFLSFNVALFGCLPCWSSCSFYLQSGLNLDGTHDAHECMGLRVKPRRGDGLLFYSLLPNGTIDPVSLSSHLVIAICPFPFLCATWIFIQIMLERFVSNFSYSPLLILQSGCVIHSLLNELFFSLLYSDFTIGWPVINTWELPCNQRHKMGGYKVDQESSTRGLNSCSSQHGEHTVMRVQCSNFHLYLSIEHTNHLNFPWGLTFLL